MGGPAASAPATSRHPTVAQILLAVSRAAATHRDAEVKMATDQQPHHTSSYLSWGYMGEVQQFSLIPHLRFKLQEINTTLSGLSWGVTLLQPHASFNK